jgi:hypothetical protein
MAEYFIRRGQTVRGPTTSTKIRELFADGKLRGDDLVRKGEDGEWVKVATIPGLVDLNNPDAELIKDPLVDLAGQAAGTVGKAAMQVGGALKGLIAKKPTTPEPVMIPAKPKRLAPDWVQTLTAEKQDPATVAQVAERIDAILMDGERIQYVAVQQKPVLNWFPDCVVLTNERFILYRPKILGRVDFEDHRWLFLSDCQLTENIIGSTLSFAVSGGTRVVLDYLPKEQARKLYRFAQEHEQRAYEERRQRRMEEARAAAGGVTVQTNVGAVAAQPPAPAAPAAAAVAVLRQLKEMQDAGLITAAEFETKKAEILKRM